MPLLISKSDSGVCELTGLKRRSAATPEVESGDTGGTSGTRNCLTELLVTFNNLSIEDVYIGSIERSLLQWFDTITTSYYQSVVFVGEANPVMDLSIHSKCIIVVLHDYPIHKKPSELIQRICEQTVLLSGEKKENLLATLSIYKQIIFSKLRLNIDETNFVSDKVLEKIPTLHNRPRKNL